MVDQAIVEVKHKAQLFEQINSIEALDDIWESNTLTYEELRKALEKALANKIRDIAVNYNYDYCKGRSKHRENPQLRKRAKLEEEFKETLQ
ncbi:MAG: hypothetical protein Q9218_002876 [Villophora microphyllina]